MDDSLQNLENELKALRPRRPSALLRARLEHELGKEVAGSADAPAPVIRTAVDASSDPRYTSATTLRSWKWLSWQMAAAAAVALVVSLGVWQTATRVTTPAPLAPPLADARTPTASTELSAGESTQSAPPAARAFANRPAADAFRPVKAANVLYDVRDEGVVLLGDNTQGRAVRARYVDTYTWKNPATNASLKWSVPRDEVRVLPASFH